MNRNLITRMGTASGVVAALVATVFAVLLNAAGDQRRHSDNAFAASGRATAALVTAARLDPASPRVRTLRAAAAKDTGMSERERADARSSARRAVALAIGGLIGSALLIGVLTAYLTQYIVVPLRRVGRAARTLASGDLSARVKEEGDAEPVELARSFNTMASSLQRNQDELSEQARINRAVLDATPDPTALLAPDGSVIVQNEEMAELGSRLPPLPDTDGEVRDEIALAGGRVLTRYAARVPDDLGRIVVLRDVTAEREAERLKDEFFALVSHELRTPLTSIIGYLELVLDDAEELDPETRRFLEVVERNAKRLLRLVGDMLFVAQVEAGRLSLETQAVDLGTVASESVEAARPAAERAGVTLALDVDAAPTVHGDRDRFGQMLDNLVSNALKFTPAGGTVTVHLSHLDALHPDEHPGAVLEVSDTGAGIPAGEQGRLFERFFRSSAAMAAAIPGVGLGLTIVKTIAEAHGGSVALTSTEGTGTTVRVEIPGALVAT